jgi:hypothetical protein
VRAQALQAVVVHDLPGLLAVGEARELLVGRVAQLDHLDADRLHVLEQSREVSLDDALAVRVGLTANRQPERIGECPARPGGQEAGDRGISGGLPEELSSGHSAHRFTPFVQTR